MTRWCARRRARSSSSAPRRRGSSDGEAVGRRALDDSALEHAWPHGGRVVPAARARGAGRGRVRRGLQARRFPRSASARPSPRTLAARLDAWRARRRRHRRPAFVRGCSSAERRDDDDLAEDLASAGGRSQPRNSPRRRARPRPWLSARSSSAPRATCATRPARSRGASAAEWRRRAMSAPKAASDAELERATPTARRFESRRSSYRRAARGRNRTASALRPAGARRGACRR